VPPRYEIRIGGQLDAAMIGAFAGLNLRFADGITVITGEFDQAALHGLLERVRVLRLDLLDVHRVRP
jgi:hypothetical protein